MSSSAPPRDARHRVNRHDDRARYDRATVHATLDAGCVAHVAFAIDRQPFVIPMLYGRDGDDILLHGSIASRLMQRLCEGIEACLAVTHLDGLVLARSHFHHSANYRSVVCFGTARAIDDVQQKATALARFVDALLPGRAAETRPSDTNELAATSVLRFTIVEASTKQRQGEAVDAPADRALPGWAGVLPVLNAYGEPCPNRDVPPDTPLPASVQRLRDRHGTG